MQRLPDWEERLHAFLDDNAVRVFEWGQWDCGLYVTAAAAAQTGVDLGKPFRGTYTTAKGAAEALRAIGAGTLQRTITALFGAPIPTAQAQRGDIIMDGRNAGICMGGHGLFLTEEGFEKQPRTAWTKAWAVGRG